MSYQVIARKWRPQKFEDVTGQESLTQTLQNAIEQQRLHHAYLFSGPRGVGKTTTARLLAKALNCHKSQQPTANPCIHGAASECSSCSEIAEGRSMDVLEIDAASNTGVENVRDVIIGSVAISPARDRYKVFIIDEVHMLSAAAFNALLKTVEEPPPRVVFIMATTERHKVPETIVSRCQVFEFRTIAVSKIFDRIKQIAGAEELDVSNDALRAIARAGEGSMRDAQSAFDQVITFAGRKIAIEDVELALGVVGSEVLHRVTKAIAENNPAEALRIVEDLVARGHDLRNFCRDLLGHFRDLLVAKAAGSDAETLLQDSSTSHSDLIAQAALFSEADLVRFFHSLADTETKLRTASNPRYQVEVGLVKLMEMRRLTPISDLLQRIARLEQSLKAGAQVFLPDSSSIDSPEASEREKKQTELHEGRRGTAGSGQTTSTAAATALAMSDEPIAETEKNTAATPDPAVEKILAVLENRRRMFIVTAIDGALRTEVVDNELCIEFAADSRHLRDTLMKTENVRLLQEACREALGRDTGVKISVAGASKEQTAASSEVEDRALREKRRLRELAEKDPTVQQVLKTFRGEIVDILMDEE